MARTKRAPAKMSTTKAASAPKAAPKPAAKGPKNPAALAKKIQVNRGRRAKAEAQIAALKQKIERFDRELDAVVASVLSAK